MTWNNLSKWNSKVSAIYAFGVWTMIGSYAYLKYSGRLEDTASEDTTVVDEVPKPNEDVYCTANSKTTIVYKKDFVPYTTRIYNFINSFGSESGTGNK